MALAPKFKRDLEEDKLLAGFRQTGAAQIGLAQPAQPSDFQPIGGFRLPERPSQTAPIAGTPSIGSITRAQEMQDIAASGPAVGFTRQLQFGDTELDAEGRVSTPIGFRDAPGGLAGSPIAIGGTLPIPGATALESVQPDVAQAGERIRVPQGLDRTQTQPATGFRSAVPRGNFIRGAGGTLTEAGGGFDLSGPRFTAGVAEELARRGEGAAFIPGEGFRGTGTAVAPAGPVAAPDTSADVGIGSRRLATPLRDFGEGGPARFEGLSAEEIVELREREALAEETPAGFRGAQRLQARRLAERKVGATETTAEAARLAATGKIATEAAKAAADTAKLTGFEFDTVSEERPIDPENPLLGSEKVITGFKGKTKGGALPTLIPIEEMTAFRTALANAQTKSDKDRLTELFTARYLSQPG